jgi:hypothetical protein
LSKATLELSQKAFDPFEELKTGQSGPVPVRVAGTQDARARKWKGFVGHGAKPGFY